MLKPVLDIAVPALVFLMMVVVGLGLTAEDFRRVARQPRLVAAATAGQVVLLPVMALGVVRLLGPRPDDGRGLLLLAACPTAPMANFYAHLARANVALAVTLTAVSCLLAVVTMPLAMAAYATALGESAHFPVPVPMIVSQLLLMLVLPIFAGMAIRRTWTEAAERHQGTGFVVSLGALAALIGLVIAQDAGAFVGALGRVVPLTAVATGLALGAGTALERAGGAGARGPGTVGIVCAARNVGIASAVAVTALGRIEFAVFATAYFLTQVPLLLGVALLGRYRGRRDVTRAEAGVAGRP